MSSRSSCNVIDAAQLAALERAVLDHGARIVNSVASGGTGASTSSGFDGDNSDKMSPVISNSLDAVPADHPAPLRRTSANAKAPKTAARGRSRIVGSESAVTVTENDRDGMTTSARIDPGIQALIADYGATGCSFPLGNSYIDGNGTLQETVAARNGGGGLLGRGGDFGNRGVGINGSTTKGHRVLNRGHDAVRRAVREQKEALRKAAAATVAVSGRDFCQAGSQEESVGVDSWERRKVQPDTRSKVKRVGCGGRRKYTVKAGLG